MKEFKFLGLEGDVNEGQITKIYVKVGDKVTKGQNLFELEAGKLSQAITADSDGEIGKINFNVGDMIKKDDVFASNEKQSTNDNVVSSTKEETTKVVVEKTPIKEENALIKDSSKVTVEINDEIKSKVTPLARNIAKSLGVDLNKVKGTGPQGRILRQDVLMYQKQESSNFELNQSSKSSSTEDIRRIKMTGMRKAIAKAMVQSKTTIPHTSLMSEVNVTWLVATRTQINNTITDKGFKVTYMPFFIKAVVKALKKFPILNASLDPNTEEIIYHDYYNIGMATDTEAGLIVPVIKQADKLNIFDLSLKVKDLATRARESKIKFDELKGSTFTITNYGSVGLSFGTPVINYPESAILGIGAIKKVPVVNDAGEIVINSILPLSISIDHRIIDGADAGRFMLQIKQLLEAPTSLLLDN